MPGNRDTGPFRGQNAPMHTAVQFRAAADGTTLAWTATGAGPAVLKVPGWLSDVGLDGAASAWGHWYRELGRGRRLVTWDPRGSGWSSRTPPGITFPLLLADMEAVAGAAALERFAIFANYLGGPLAVAFAARHPDRVSHLVLHGASAVGPLSPAADDAARAEAEAIAALIETSWGSDPTVIDQFLTVQLLPDAGPDVWHALRSHQQRAAAPEMAARLFRACEAADVTGDARRVRCPVLVTHSSGDTRIGTEAARQLATLLRGRFAEVPSRNHVLLETEPAWEAWCELLRGFLPSEGSSGQETAPAPPQLSAREGQVLELLARGLDNPAIARRLVVSEKTVRNYVSTLFDKLGVATRAEAIVAARAAGYGLRQPER
jgi:pimeloyl-ACP methyl ester carboxylesterase/DNA-binding CsgD family transcriptional regulator